MKIIVLLFILGLVALQGLFGNGLPISHDGPDHVARIANFYQSFREGNIFPRWAGNLNWGYGHPILMFLYPLPSYTASLFHFLGFSFQDSTKLVFGFFYIASLLTMYTWLSQIFHRFAAFTGSLLYGFAAYRFIDLYVRGAIGEHVAFVFLPLILLGLLFVSRNEKHAISALCVSLGTAGLLLSHNALSVMYFPIIGLYVLYLFIFETTHKKNFIVQSIFFVGIGVCISAFFSIPAFLEGKYTLRDILTKGEYATRFVEWPSFFLSPWNYGGSNEFSKEIGLVQWSFIALSILVFFKIKLKKSRIFLLGLFFVFFISLFMMTSQSMFVWSRITILEKFQFPWRFLSVSVFAAAVIGAIVIDSLSEGKRKIIMILASILLMWTTQHMWKANGYIQKPNILYSGMYPGTTDTGESSPIWSIRFMEKGPLAPIEIIKGDANVTSLERTNERHVYSIVVTTPEARMLENTLYFPGWTLLIDQKEVPIENIEFQNPVYRGLMTFNVPTGSHSIILEFRETKLRKIANVITVCAIGVLFGLIIMPYVRRIMASKT